MNNKETPNGRHGDLSQRGQVPSLKGTIKNCYSVSPKTILLR